MDNEKKIIELLEDAQKLFENNEYHSCEKRIIEILKISPLNTKANEILAYVRANNGEAKSAHDLLLNACLDVNCSPEAQYYLGVSFLNLNKYSDAIINFNRSIKKAGDFYEGLHDLGVAQAKLGLLEDAIKNFEKACFFKNTSSVYFNLGNIYEKKEENEKALLNYNKATTLSSNYAEAWFEKANLLTKLNRFNEAINCYDIALNNKKNKSEYLINKGVTLYKLKKYEEALQCFKIVIENEPYMAKAWNEAGVVLCELMEYEKALIFIDKAIEINPKTIDSWINKSVAFIELKKYNCALAACKNALKLDSEKFEAITNYGVILSNLNKTDEALLYYDKAIELNKSNSKVYSNKGEALNLKQKYNDAIINFNIAIENDNNSVDARHNRAYANFSLFNFKEAWEDYKWRWSLKTMISSKLVTNKPEWFGEKEDGRLFIWAEQGIGEQIMFSSLFSILRNYPQQKIVSLDKKLITIYKRSFPDFSFFDREIKLNQNEYDKHCSIGDLGSKLSITLEDLGKRLFPYLKHNEFKYHKNNFATSKKDFICGLSWKSYGKNFGKEKSIPLEAFEEILAINNFKFLNLQYEIGNFIPSNEKKIIEKYNIINNNNIKIYENIDEFCNLIMECDIVITCSNSTAHLAGALNKHTVLIIPKERGRFWYWSGNQKISIWYPSVHIITQENLNNWKLPILELKKYLINFKDKLNN